MAKDPSLLSAVKDLKEFGSKNIEIKHNITLPSIPDLVKYKEVFEEIEIYVKTAKTYSKISAKVAKNIFLVVFLWVFFSSKSYHQKYLTDISFDNNYITNYFRKIDARRKKAVNNTIILIIDFINVFKTNF